MSDTKKFYKDFCKRFGIKCDRIDIPAFGQPLYRFRYDKIPDNEDYLPEIGSIIFIQNKDHGRLEPYMYNVQGENNEVTGIIVEEGDVIYDWIRYIRRASETYNAKKQKMVSGTLNVVQWIVSTMWLQNIVQCNGKVLGLAGSRQIGKSHLASYLGGFAPIFLPKYMDIETDRFWLVVCSYKDDSVGKVFLNIKEQLEKSIEIHNEYYDEKLYMGNDKEIRDSSKNYKSTNKVVEIAIKLRNGKVIPYSCAYAVSTNTTNDGLTAHLMILDEPQETVYEDFTKTEGFTGTTNGCIVLTGIGSERADDVQSHYYNLARSSPDDVIFTRIPFPVYFNTASYFWKSRAKKAFGKFCKLANSWGGTLSDMMSCKHLLARFDSMDGKFITRKILDDFGVQKLPYIINKPKASNIYRVAGVDFASSQDYQVMTIMDIYRRLEKCPITGTDTVMEDYELVDIITFNRDKERLDHEESGARIASLCQQYQVDMLTGDGTGTQAPYLTMIVKFLVSAGIGTLVASYSFSNDNKEIMMKYAEGALFSGRLKMFSEVVEKQHFSYGKLIKEMIELVKEKDPNKRNIQYKAPVGKSFSDDHVMSFVLSVFTLQNIANLIMKKKNIMIEKLEYVPFFNKYHEAGETIEEEFITTYGTHL